MTPNFHQILEPNDGFSSAWTPSHCAKFVLNDFLMVDGLSGASESAQSRYNVTVLAVVTSNIIETVIMCSWCRQILETPLAVGSSYRIPKAHASKIGKLQEGTGVDVTPKFQVK